MKVPTNNNSNTPKNKSKLLLDSNPLIIIPELAVLIGLNESIILQQIHYWLQKSDHFYDGRAWVYNSVPQWCEQFPFLSQRSIERALAALKNLALILTANYNKLKQDRTLWYTIDYDALEALQEKSANTHKNPSRQNGGMVPPQEEEPSNPHEYSHRQNGGMVLSNWQDDHDNLGRPLPEITTEITPEKESQSVCQSTVEVTPALCQTTDGRTENISPTETEKKELERMYKNGQVYLYHSRLFLESVIKKLYTDGQIPYILKMGLTQTDIQDRLRLLTHAHLDAALAKMEGCKTNKELYFAKCLLTAIVEIHIDELLQEEPPIRPTSSTEKVPQRDRFDQRE